jgi:hypothetical protein
MLTRNALVTVVVDGTTYGTWITKSGGQVEADGQKTRLGGMSSEIALGGPASRENVTVSKLFDAVMQTKYKVLETKVGTASMTVTYTPLGNDKRPVGDAITYSGILNRVTVPEADDNAAETAMIELELLANELAG